MKQTNNIQEIHKLLNGLTGQSDFEVRIASIVKLTGNLPTEDRALFFVYEWAEAHGGEATRDAQENMGSFSSVVEMEKVCHVRLAEPWCKTVRQMRKVVRAERRRRASLYQITVAEWDDWAEWEAPN